jgi:hypothetical protein
MQWQVAFPLHKNISLKYLPIKLMRHCVLEQSKKLIMLYIFIKKRIEAQYQKSIHTRSKSSAFFRSSIEEYFTDFTDSKIEHTNELPQLRILSP